MMNTNMTIPVYVFAVFWKAARTPVYKRYTSRPGFTENEKTLIVCCEEGEEEYDEDFLKKRIPLSCRSNQKMISKAPR